MPPSPASEHRCQHRSPAGRRCRLPLAPGHPALCLHHARSHERHQLAESLAELTAHPTDFSSAAAINRFLANLLARAAHGLIPRRDAALQGYLCQLLLNTLPALRLESLDQAALDESALAETGPCPEPSPVLICDIPRPNRSLPPAATPVTASEPWDASSAAEQMRR